MKEIYGTLPSGETAYLYTITCGNLSAAISDFGATLVKLFVPNQQGELADIVLGFDTPGEYITSNAFFGATVGRNANRVHNSSFVLSGKTYSLARNEGPNNLHSGPDGYHLRMWKVAHLAENEISLVLDSPHEDQGFPGNAHIHVTYTLEPGCLKIRYDGESDRDTVFNMTNHSYFNLAGHDHPECALEQTLCMPARFYTPCDAASIPTGECRNVEGTPMDFRTPKPIGQDIDADYDSLKLQSGYDHNFEVFCAPCAILSHEASGRTMSISTDCPGIQFYSANFTDAIGKGGVHYCRRSGIALETQFYPDSVNHPEWPQPFVKAGEKYHSETVYRFA